MRDRDLVRLYWPVELRPAFDALLDIDGAMADVVAKATEPALGAIKLAWWRERLLELDEGKVPAEPRLQAAAVELLARGVAGASLAELEDGWAGLLDEEPDIERAGERGFKLFTLAAVLLEASDPLTEAAGRLYGYASAARVKPDVHFWPMEEMHQLARHRFPRKLRPLTALARLAARDARNGPTIEAEATPARASALFRHWIGGRIA
jgi:15-cis-phytoene synthase